MQLRAKRFASRSPYRFDGNADAYRYGSEYADGDIHAGCTQPNFHRRPLPYGHQYAHLYTSW